MAEFHDYLKKHNIADYFEDAVARMLEERPDKAAKFLYEYFEGVRNGSNVVLREFAYVKATVRNRLSFVDRLEECLAAQTASDVKMTEASFSARDYHQFIDLISLDVPYSLTEVDRLKALLKVINAKSSKTEPFAVAIPTSEFTFYFKTCLCNYEFIEALERIVRESFSNLNKQRLVNGDEAHSAEAPYAPTDLSTVRCFFEAELFKEGIAADRTAAANPLAAAITVPKPTSTVPEKRKKSSNSKAIEAALGARFDLDLKIFDRRGVKRKRNADAAIAYEAAASTGTKKRRAGKVAPVENYASAEESFDDGEDLMGRAMLDMEDDDEDKDDASDGEDNDARDVVESLFARQSTRGVGSSSKKTGTGVAVPIRAEQAPVIVFDDSRRVDTSFIDRREKRAFMAADIRKMMEADTVKQAANPNVTKEEAELDKEDDRNDRELMELLKGSRLLEDFTASQLEGKDRRKYTERRLVELGAKAPKRERMPPPMKVGLLKSLKEKSEKRLQTAKDMGLYHSSLRTQILNGDDWSAVSKASKPKGGGNRRDKMTEINGSVGIHGDGILRVPKKVIKEINKPKGGAGMGGKGKKGGKAKRPLSSTARALKLPTLGGGVVSKAKSTKKKGKKQEYGFCEIDANFHHQAVQPLSGPLRSHSLVSTYIASRIDPSSTCVLIMGQRPSREVENLKDETHFTLNEIKRLKLEFEKQSDSDFTITKDQFKQTLQNHVHCWSAGAQYLFLERLFDAFDLDGNHKIDFREFIQGLSAFMKGTPEEKMELSFRLYDIDKSGSIEPKELIKIMGQMYSAFYNEDQSDRIKEVVMHIFDDLDINGDGSLSLTEYKLMALKEPMIIDFLEQFLIVAADDERRS
ncbi:hypothetical protein HK101_004402 [Irineochytrium annulatum]|nr:hypothetical protein HK101_004402 [Irineochytrium annulatum]